MNDFIIVVVKVKWIREGSRDGRGLVKGEGRSLLVLFNSAYTIHLQKEGNIYVSVCFQTSLFDLFQMFGKAFVWSNSPTISLSFVP